LRLHANEKKFEKAKKGSRRCCGGGGSGVCSLLFSLLLLQLLLLLLLLLQGASVVRHRARLSRLEGKEAGLVLLRRAAKAAKAAKAAGRERCERAIGPGRELSCERV
jgi:hypothetical protein